MSARIEVNYEGVGELLKSVEVADMLSAYSSEVMSDLNMDDYDMRIVDINTRKVAHINAKTEKALLDNFDENVLLKALGKH